MLRCRAWSRAAGRAAARHTGRPGGQPGGAGRAALRAGFRRGRRRRSAAADRDRRAASGVCRRAAAGAVDRCVARAGDGGARAAALFGAARGLRDRRAAHELRGGCAVHPARLAHGAVPAAVHRAARPAGLVRLRPAGAHDDAGIQHPGVARDPVACAGGRDAHGAPLLRSAGRLALRQGASARGHRRAAGLAGRRQRSDAERGLGRVRPCRGARTGLHRRDRPPGHAQRADGDDRPLRGDAGA